MLKFSLGVLAGVAGTVAYHQWASPARADEIAPPAPARVAAAAVRSGTAPGLTPAASAPAQRPVALRASVASPAPVASPPVPVAAPPAVPAMEAVALSQEHRTLLQGIAAASAHPETIADLHQRLEREGRDPAWSTEVEQNLRQYLAQHAGSPDFDIVGVQCRRTLCEIQAFGYAAQANDKWNAIMGHMGEQPWWSFMGMSTTISSVNGKSVLMTVLTRKG